ncbi:NAD(P)-dependent oxidoreductase [Chitinophaga vietnamensis]|uniref:NAD(P)-dependent oxidoreductase n=1 Tax=Chitinophaga vietnamensis TaxID=2593957 RepID=UPI001177BB8D|nr:NAD(P)-dependent oxidoreductase [Chitinophaga vietnamensis]
MKVAIIGASGFIGTEILKEALQRGHTVTAIVRNPEKISLKDPHLTVKQGDVTNEDTVAKLVSGNDAVISAFNAHDSATYVKAIHAIINGAKKAGVTRLLAVSGAGSLEVAPGVQILDTPEFPEQWKAGATATRDALNVLRQEKELDWTALSPAAEIFPGERTGKYRTGKDQLLTDANGHSKISSADYAIALVDELEKPQFKKQRFTVAY